MNIKLNAFCLSGLIALGTFLSQPVKADEWNKRTEFQFSVPVQIPGKVLAPGKYVFQLADIQSSRTVVQVFSEDAGGHDTLVTTVLAVPDYVYDTPDKPTVQFEERRSGNPEAIHSWFYPGDNTGWELVYSGAEAPAANSN